MISEAYSNIQNVTGNVTGNIRNDNYVKVVEEKQIPIMLQSLDNEVQRLGNSLEKLFSQLQSCSTIISSSELNNVDKDNFCLVATRIKNITNSIYLFSKMVDNQCDALQL